MDPITDAHTHAFPDQLAPRAVETIEGMQTDQPGACIDGTVGGLLRSMERAGIGRSVICSIATAPGQAGSILRWSSEIAGDRIVAFASAHPAAPDPAGDVARVAESGLPGIKLHAQYQGFDMADAALRPIFEAVREHGLILALHCGLDFGWPDDDERAHPQKIAALHREFPEIPLITTHLGGWRRWESALRCLAGTHVYMETSYSFGHGDPELLRRITDAHPPERILFGTDSPWQDQAEALRRVRDWFPDPEVRELVLRRNAARLLGG